MVRFILPQQGLGWLATISGNADQAYILGERAHRADGLSVASDLAVGVPARMPSARRKPLVARLLTTPLLSLTRLPAVARC